MKRKQLLSGRHATGIVTRHDATRSGGASAVLKTPGITGGAMFGTAMLPTLSVAYAVIVIGQ